MKTGGFVLVHLSGPREKFWGLLEHYDASGVTVRGLGIDGFEEWLREIARAGSPSFFPATVFFPLHRVERISIDETAGEAVSLADRFRRQIGKDPADYLGGVFPKATGESKV